MKLLDLVNPREIRRRLGLNQEEFWTRIGVTQSGGSRYESGRSMPKPVRELLRLVHVERIDLGRVKKEDFEIIEHLRGGGHLSAAFFFLRSGGRCEIRTHEGLAPLPVFKTGAFNRSANLPFAPAS